MHKISPVILFFAVFRLWAQEPIAVDLSAPIALVADAQTGEILFSRGEDIPIAPASLAKIMTLYLVNRDIQENRYQLGDIVTIDTESAGVFMRPGSSVLPLNVGDRVSVRTLMRAAAVASANDAAWALARLGGGRPETFVFRMNRAAESLGMSDTQYADPDGWSADSFTTAMDQLKLAMAYIEEFPGALPSYHSLPDMIYQSEDSILSSDGDPKKNTNLLIARTPGVDGLKTGTVPEAGFHFVATAKRGNTRFIVLVMGIQEEDFISGLRRRALEAEQLIEWAFAGFETRTLRVPPVDPLTVRHGEQKTLGLAPVGDRPVVTIPVNTKVSVRVQVPDLLEAPISEDSILGSVEWRNAGQLIARQSLAAAHPVPRRWRFSDFLQLIFE